VRSSSCFASASSDRELGHKESRQRHTGHQSAALLADAREHVPFVNGHSDLEASAPSEGRVEQALPDPGRSTLSPHERGDCDRRGALPQATLERAGRLLPLHATR